MLLEKAEPESLTAALLAEATDRKIHTITKIYTACSPIATS